MKKDIFGDDIENKETEDFASLFANSTKNLSTKLKVGDRITAAEILSIGKEESFIATGAVQDGIIDTRELLDENKQLAYKMGDRIDVFVTHFKNGEIRLSKKSGNKGLAGELEDAFDHMLPVEGRVSEVVNGGVRVVIMGKTAFCPISQLDLKYVEDPKTYLNQKFEFMITKLDNRDVVVSRKKLLEQQKEENIWAFKDNHKIGDVVTVKAQRLEKFGVFVEIEPQVEGLVHISELGWSRLQDPSEVVKVGDSFQAKIIKMEEEKGRLKISLSRKQAEQDPWEDVVKKYQLGSIHTGTVTRKEGYGFFVQLEPGVTGLMPKSSWKDHLEPQQFDNKKLGEKVTVQVREINKADKRISLAPPQDGVDNSWQEFDSSKSQNLGTLADQFKGLFEKKK